MDNAARFFENYVNLDRRILGVGLKPFCLLHVLWLQNINSPFFETVKPVVIEDLELAVMICSCSTSEEILAKLNAPAGIWQRFKRKHWHRSNRRKELQAEVRAFLAYQDDYCSIPEFYQSGDISQEKLPWPLLYLASLVKATGWSEQAVLTLPLGKVIWLNAAFGYLNSGDTGIVSDKERLAMRALTGGGR